MEEQADIWLTIVGTQTDAAGVENRLELLTPARYWQRNGVEYIIYAETAVSGLEGTTTTLKLYADHVCLLRMGEVQQKQEFWPGVTRRSLYVTPFGRLDMGVLTNKLERSFSDTAGKTGMIDIEYELDIDGCWQSVNTLSITVREEQNFGHQGVIATHCFTGGAAGRH